MAARTPPDRLVPMRIIVCGVHRTGTLSIRHALYALGLHDIHHMVRVRNSILLESPQWIKAFEAKYARRGDFTVQDWDKLLGDCQGVCDIPAAFFGAEIADAYPDAKVVILNRDPEEWYNSVLNSIWEVTTLGQKLRMIFCVFFDRETRAWVVYGKTMSGHVFGYNHRKEKDKALAWYKKQYDEYRERIPAERRIEYTVGDGWGPLCEFLDMDVPMEEDGKTEKPFPRLNDRSSFLEDMDRVRTNAMQRAVNNLFGLVGRAAVSGSVAYVGYLMWKTRLGGRV